MDFVQHVWSVPAVGTGLVSLASKLKKIKVALCEWNKQVFGRTNVQIATLEKKLEQLNCSLQRDWNEDDERELVSSSIELSLGGVEKILGWLKWLSLSGKWKETVILNFSIVCLANKRNKRIQEMRTLDGVEFSSPEDNHLGVVNYFSGFLQNTNKSRELPDLSYLISPVIDEADCARICRTPSLDEVHEAFSSIPINSSLGPDGFGVGFFKSSLEVVKMDVLEAISDFFISKTLLRFYSTSFTVLFSKMDVP
ncbi:uncharacterized protein LOC122312605 [Carya illinoinensis]|uniref:uncharacterized protein LOC122312605 n=1 Tax=Carya illinoinensis TaxID=32201 RepID=UPI001C72209B|nr:uncharacterized protein LOC122312605 [Carya illinoinensis]